MSMTRPPRDWIDIRWSEIDRKAASDWIAVLPLAAVEQHGPHLPLGTDAMIGEANLARTRELLPDTLPVSFLPMQAVGLSIEHTDFPGTQSLSTETALSAWNAIGDSVARAGVRKLVMITSHGGNSAAMTLVAQELRVRHRMLAVTTGWHRFGMPDGLFPADEVSHGIHGGAVETSIMLAAFPQYVKQDALADFTPASVAMAKEFKWLGTRGAPFAWMAQDLHESGAGGNATLATADKGRALIDHAAKGFVELLADVHKFDLARLKPPPK